MTIERLVRPFQLGDVFNARQLPPQQPPQEPKPPVVITIEGDADAQYQEEPPPWTFGFQVEWQEIASRRKTETVKITSPSDPSVFVEVEKYKEATFKNSSSGEEQTFKFGA